MVGRTRRPFEKLKPEGVKRTADIGMYADGGGLYLQVSRFSTKSWIFRFMLDGRRREMGLGPFPAVSLADAWKKAAYCRTVVRGNRIDPIAARNARRDQVRIDAAKVMTFHQWAEAYITAHQAGWRNPKHRAQWLSTLEAYVYPVFGSLPVQAVDVGLVLKTVEPIWPIKPETASRFAAASRASWIGLWPAAIAEARTLPDGAVILETCCRRRRRFAESSTTQLCPMSISATSRSS
jgi:hypothetical protein